MENRNNSSDCKLLLGFFLGILTAFLVTVLGFWIADMHLFWCSPYDGNFTVMYLSRLILFGVLMLCTVICFTVILVKYMRLKKESARLDWDDKLLQKATENILNANK